ncbi:MAG: multidrug transporter AcrB [Proteobacteria bacterium]|nr:MAG: multidrug transporter AcrB [Pseudomonadota bacterium]
MILSDISIKRPVFATVMSLLLIAFGALSFTLLPLREYPDIDTPVVSITTVYRGASSDIVETKVTKIIEDEVSGIEGVRAIQSSSQDGRSTVNIEFTVNRDIDVAANDVRDRVSRILDELPQEADPPTVAKAESDGSPIFWVNIMSETRDGMALTDYAERYLVDQFTVIDGVAQIWIGGERRYAMRIWIDRKKLAARGLTVADIENALREENVELPAGRLESTNRELSLRVARSYKSPQDFANLVLTRGADGYLVRLGEVAKVELGAEEDRNEFRGNGRYMIGLGIIKQSKANLLDVARATHAKMDEIKPSLPSDISMVVGADDSVFVEAAIFEVYKTLIIALILVIIVIYLFLGSVRAVLIPAVTVPVSLMASFMVLAMFGYSVNLVTLLALVLAIGLVVDDSIVVLENIHRRVEEGEPPLIASYHGARQVTVAVVATTLVLIAVFVPILFLGGNVGRIFKELAVTLGGAVAFSAFAALSLSPMMSSKLLDAKLLRTGLSHRVDQWFTRLNTAYGNTLGKLFARPKVIIIAFAASVAAILALFAITPQEFVPSEDRGKIFVLVSGPEGSSFEATVRSMRRIENILMEIYERGEATRVLARVPGFGSEEQVNTGIAIVTLKDFGERERSSDEIIKEIFGKLQSVPGVFAVPVVFGGLKGVGGGRGKPVQFVIGGDSYEELARWRDIMLERIRENPALIAVETDLKETKPQILVIIDQDRAADLGVTVSNIGRTLETMFNARRVTTYIDRGEEYDVMLQGREEDRRSPTDLSNIYVRSETSGVLVPLSSLVKFEERGSAATLNRFNRQRAVTISANVAPGYTLGEALTFLETTAKESLPQRARIDYRGESREFKDSSSALFFIFGLALLVVYLVLAAQFESFIHPMVIMLTVPLAIVGALLGLLVTNGTLNIYSEIGIVMLVGIAAKNGILIVEFINQLRDAGREFTDAIIEASRIRLRPILMTAFSTVMGALPLILSTGAGSESRYSLGVVIFAGVAVATLFTLFVVPVFYYLLARHTKSPGHVAAELKKLQAAE